MIVLMFVFIDFDFGGFVVFVVWVAGFAACFFLVWVWVFWLFLVLYGGFGCFAGFAGTVYGWGVVLLRVGWLLRLFGWICLFCCFVVVV